MSRFVPTSYVFWCCIRDIQAHLCARNCRRCRLRQFIHGFGCIPLISNLSRSTALRCGCKVAVIVYGCKRYPARDCCPSSPFRIISLVLRTGRCYFGLSWWYSAQPCLIRGPVPRSDERGSCSTKCCLLWYAAQSCFIRSLHAETWPRLEWAGI